jgi:hypothetical protein
MKIKKVTDFKVGDRESFSKTITESNVYLYAGMSVKFPFERHPEGIGMLLID